MRILPQNASIRFKVVSAVLISTLVLIVLIVLISSGILLKSYVLIENEQATKNVQRANDALENVVAQLQVKIKDWSSWDDTYEFVKDKNHDYTVSNLGNSSIANLKINAMVFVNTEGMIVFKKAIELKNNREISSESIASYLESHPRLTAHSSTESAVGGIAILPEGPFLFVSQPILTSNSEGPIHGALIFGKFLNDEMVASVEKLTHLSVTLFPYEGTAPPEDIRVAKNELVNEKGYFITPLSHDLIAAYKILYDLDNKPVLILRVETSRQIYTQGLNTIYIVTAIASVSIFLFGILVLLFLEKIIISRLLMLGTEVEKVSVTGDLSFRVNEGERDEIGKLAIIINHLFVKVASSERFEKEVKERTIELEEAKLGLEKAVRGRTAELEKMKSDLEKTVMERTEKLNEKLSETEEVNKLMVDRELKMVELKNEIAILKEQKQSSPGAISL